MRGIEVPNGLKEVLADNREARLIETSIYSVLPDASPHHHYDRRSALYDSVVGTRLYNYLMWGTSPRDYTDFARDAVRSRTGKLLDAGCGSMLFTAAAYIDSARPVIAFDQSLAMLRRARQRLIELSGSVPEHILLVQADLSDLPFRAHVFPTVLFMNVLHQFEAASTLIPKLAALLDNQGALYLTSLVTNQRLVGDWYLRALYATGEFVRPRSSGSLQETLSNTLGAEINFRTSGNMAYVTTKV